MRNYKKIDMLDAPAALKNSKSRIFLNLRYYSFYRHFIRLLRILLLLALGDMRR